MTCRVGSFLHVLDQGLPVARTFYDAILRVFAKASFFIRQEVIAHGIPVASLEREESFSIPKKCEIPSR
jgi:hypothetical protein